jgi:hypothetical protein
MTDISGKSIKMFPADDSGQTVTRSYIIPVDITTKIKETKSIGNKVSRCSVTEILKYYLQTDSDKVRFD